MSRAEKYKVQKRDYGQFSWLLGILMFGSMIYPISYLFQIPDDLMMRQTMQILLFLMSILFLGLYLLSFVVASTKTFTQSDTSVNRINYTILSFWVLSLLYHFSVWVIEATILTPYFYYIGLALTLSAFILTLLHFCAYFSFVKKDRVKQTKKELFINSQRAYEHLHRTLENYHLLVEATHTDPEVQQMMKWNGFDREMESQIHEIENYLHVTTFTEQEVRHILRVKAWMDHLITIVEQHPLHKGLRR